MAPMKNFHVPLPEELYRKLRIEAEKSKHPATEIARQAIEKWLQEREREELRQSIISYATKHANSEEDLDEKLEKASLEFLSNEEQE